MLNTVMERLMGDPSIGLTDFCIPVAVSLVLGLVLALVHLYRNTSSRSFVISIALLPAIVCVVIMAVNGNIGAGVAVAGSFSLVRFRSAPGSAREIVSLFLAMAAGLLTGTGYLLYAGLFIMILSLVMILYRFLDFGRNPEEEKKRSLRITIPEDLDYTGIFDDIMETYTSAHQLISSKTTGMGSMFKLTYEVIMKRGMNEKEFVDALRCRNGNLEIALSALTFAETTEL